MVGPSASMLLVISRHVLSDQTQLAEPADKKARVFAVERGGSGVGLRGPCRPFSACLLRRLRPSAPNGLESDTMEALCNHHDSSTGLEQSVAFEPMSTIMPGFASRPMLAMPAVSANELLGRSEGMFGGSKLPFDVSDSAFGAVSILLSIVSVCNECNQTMSTTILPGCSRYPLTTEAIRAMVAPSTTR